MKFLSINFCELDLSRKDNIGDHIFTKNILWIFVVPQNCQKFIYSKITRIVVCRQQWITSTVTRNNCNLICPRFSCFHRYVCWNKYNLFHDWSTSMRDGIESSRFLKYQSFGIFEILLVDSSYWVFYKHYLFFICWLEVPKCEK